SSWRGKSAFRKRQLQPWFWNVSTTTWSSSQLVICKVEREAPNIGLEPTVSRVTVLAGEAQATRHAARGSTRSLGRFEGDMSQLVHADHLQWAFARLLIVVGVTGLLVGSVGFVHFHCRPEDSLFLVLGASVIGPAATVAVLAHLRQRRWPRTVAYAVGTGFGSLVIFAILVPRERPVPHRARVAVAMEHMRELGRQLEAGQQISRATDPWGDPYVVYTTSSGYTV